MTLIEQIQQYNAELLRFRAMLDDAFAKGAKASDKPEDRVVFPLLVSTRDIMEEILFEISNGFGRAAFRSVRTIYEALVAAHHLHLHPEKTMDFLNLMYVQWAKIAQNIPETLRQGTDMHAKLSAEVPKYAQGKPIGMHDLDWSDSYTLAMAREAGALADLHPLVFDHASAYIHPIALFVISGMTHDPNTQEFHLSVKSQDQEGTMALRGAHDLLLNAVALRLKYAPSDTLKMQLTQCEQDFLNIWNYPAHI
jgi:hypothetical protein